MNLNEYMARAGIKLTDTQKTRAMSTLRALGCNTDNIADTDVSVISRVLKSAASSAANRPNPLTANVKRIEAQAMTACPLCGIGMQTVKINGDRDVLYCAEHFVTLPLPVAG